MRDLKSKDPAGSAATEYERALEVSSHLWLYICVECHSASFILAVVCCLKDKSRTQIKWWTLIMTGHFSFSRKVGGYCYCGFCLKCASFSPKLHQIWDCDKRNSVSQGFFNEIPCGTTVTVVATMTFTADSPPLEPNSTFWLPQSTSCCGC